MDLFLDTMIPELYSRFLFTIYAARIVFKENSIVKFPYKYLL